MPAINKINLFLPINPAVKNRQENIQKTDFSGFTGNKPVSYSAVSAENFKAYSVVPASRVNLFPSKIGFSGKFYEINTGETAFPVLKIEENPNWEMNLSCSMVLEIMKHKYLIIMPKI